MEFNELRLKATKPETRFIGRLLTFDPGETTGWSSWEVTEEEAKLVQSGQIKTWPIKNAVDEFTFLLNAHQPDIVVFESYQVYEWKAEDHTWSQIPTVQIIGCLRTLLIQMSIPEHTQTAQVAKQFCKDEKLEEWGLWKKGERHARDALRHACYYILFGKKSAQNLTS